MTESTNSAFLIMYSNLGSGFFPIKFMTRLLLDSKLSGCAIIFASGFEALSLDLCILDIAAGGSGGLGGGQCRVRGQLFGNYFCMQLFLHCSLFCIGWAGLGRLGVVWEWY